MASQISPRDTTPIVIDGDIVNREDIGEIKIDDDFVIDPNAILSEEKNLKTKENKDESSEVKAEEAKEDEPFKGSKGSKKNKVSKSERVSGEEEKVKIPKRVIKLATQRKKEEEESIRREEELKKQESIRREEELKKQEEARLEKVKQEEEMKRQEELKRQEEINKVKQEVKVLAQKPYVPEHPDYSSLTPTEKAVVRSAFVTKFSDLRRHHQYLGIPEIKDETLEELYVMYEHYRNHINIINNVDNYYNLGMAAVFYLIEYLLTQVLSGKDKANSPVKGFAAAQLRNIITYNNMLIEIGEKFNAQGGTEAAPVEFRLAATLLMSAVSYAAINFFANKVGVDGSKIEDFIKTLTGNKPSQTVQATQGEAKASLDPRNVPDAPPQVQGGGGLMGALPGLLGGLGNLDVGNIMNLAGGLLSGLNGQNGAKKEERPRAQRRPPHAE